MPRPSRSRGSAVILAIMAGVAVAAAAPVVVPGHSNVVLAANPHPSPPGRADKRPKPTPTSAPTPAPKPAPTARATSGSAPGPAAGGRATPRPAGGGSGGSSAGSGNPAAPSGSAAPRDPKPSAAPADAGFPAEERATDADANPVAGAGPVLPLAGVACLGILTAGWGFLAGARKRRHREDETVATEATGASAPASGRDDVPGAPGIAAMDPLLAALRDAGRSGSRSGWTSRPAGGTDDDPAAGRPAWVRRLDERMVVLTRPDNVGAPLSPSILDDPDEDEQVVLPH